VCSGEPENREKFIKHIPKLLACLIDCFKDASWPVRDAACLACGYFVGTFPKESEENFEELLKLWIAHLSDNIYSVRHHSAVALSTVFKQAEMYQEVLMGSFTEFIKSSILKAKTDQKESSS
jgi:hypothetical protein